MSDMIIATKQLVKGCQTLVMDPTSNKTTATIIGEYSASYYDSALISTWFRTRISGSDQNLAYCFFCNTSLMSDMIIATKQLVKGCQTLVMDPRSLLQQSLVNTQYLF